MDHTPLEKLRNPVLILLLMLALPAGGHSGDRLYPFAYLSDEMLAEIQLEDGQIYEWMDLLGEPAMTLLDFKDEGAQELAPNPADLDFRIWLAWHDEPARLYVAVVTSDDVYDNNHDYHGVDLESLIELNDSIMFVDMAGLVADGFVDGILLPAAAAEPEGDTAIRAVSWGRIKASLEVDQAAWYLRTRREIP